MTRAEDKITVEFSPDEFQAAAEALEVVVVVLLVVVVVVVVALHWA